MHDSPHKAMNTLALHTIDDIIEECSEVTMGSDANRLFVHAS